VRFSRLVESAAALACAAGLACAAAAQDPLSERDLLRARVEQIQEQPGTLVRGVPIASRRVLPTLYERRDFELAWTREDAREQLLRAIRDSAADGLEPEDYLLGALEALKAEAFAPGAPLDARIDYDLLSSEALARLLYHLIFGKVDPHALDPHWNFTRQVHRQDPAAFLQEVIDSGDVYAAIAREKPSDRMYRALVDALARYRELAAHGGFPAVPPGPTLAPGDRSPRVAALRARLAASGDLASGASEDPELYDDSLGAAVAAFQTRHGLDVDGRVGARTLAALDEPIATRIEQLRVNLERGRWLLHDLDPTFVVVNIAGFEVYYLRDGQLLWNARAIIGQPYRETPIFRSEITYLVFNPTWTVPPGIFRMDILPAQKRKPSYLASRNLRVVDGSGRVIPAKSIDWAHTTPKNFRYQLVQEAGPDNALGRVKFVFPNSYAVYMHDTPARNLFDKSERAFSSGCIRIENPLELAALLLEGQPGWDRAAIDRAVEEGKTRTVSLTHPVPVLLAYWTAWVDRAGAVQFRRDLYDRDAKVAAGLAAPLHPRRAAG